MHSTFSHYQIVSHSTVSAVVTACNTAIFYYKAKQENDIYQSNKNLS